MLTRSLLWYTHAVSDESGNAYAEPSVEMRIRTFWDGLAIEERSVVVTDAELIEFAKARGNAVWTETDAAALAVEKL